MTKAHAILAYAAKALKELHESQVIAGKGAGTTKLARLIRSTSLTFTEWQGKQWVYHAVQDPDDALSLDDLAAMDKEIATLRDSIITAKANEKLLRANLIAVNATLSTEELRRGDAAGAGEEGDFEAVGRFEVG